MWQLPGICQLPSDAPYRGLRKPRHGILVDVIQGGDDPLGHPGIPLPFIYDGFDQLILLEGLDPDPGEGDAQELKEFDALRFI